jgi:hypothetical protein
VWKIVIFCAQSSIDWVTGFECSEGTGTALLFVFVVALTLHPNRTFRSLALNHHLQYRSHRISITEELTYR